MNGASAQLDWPLRPQAGADAQAKTGHHRGRESRHHRTNLHQAAPAYPQLVPEELLSLPLRDEPPHLFRREAAELLDHHLQHLASHEARCRLTLGRLAQVLLGRRVYRELGFVRAGDYTSERLGLSARELQSLAQVTKSLAGHPELARAFESGEISWTELRKRVTGVTGAADETSAADKKAQGAVADPTDAKTEVRQDGATEATGPPADDRTEAAGTSADVGAGQSADTDADTDAEPHASSDALANDANDLDDLIDGEAPVEFRLSCPPSVRLLWRQAVELASRASGSSLAYWQAAEVISAEALASLGGGEQPAEESPGALTVNMLPSAASGTAQAGQPTADDYAETGLCKGPHLPPPPPRSVFPAASLPADVADLIKGLDTVTDHELDARLRHAVSAMQSLDWQTGSLLRTLFSLRLHSELGFSSTSLYIRARLRLSVRKARGLVAIERATLLRCPQLSRAYRCGRISWLRALAILPVLSDGSGHLWVERAARVTLRRLHDEVTWALNRADATQGHSGLTPPPLGVAIDPLDSDLVRASGSADTNSSNATSAVHFGARRGCGGTSFSSVDIRFFGPLTVVGMLDEAMRLTRRPGEPRWRAMQRLLCLVMQEWNSQPRHRDPVFARDGWRCSVPACSSRRNLHDHHVVFRSHGGDSSLGNRVAVCAGHHLYGIHRGHVHVTGSLRSRSGQAGALHWKLGTRARGYPLMELVGDIYIAGAPGETSVSEQHDRRTFSTLAIPETLG